MRSPLLAASLLLCFTAAAAVAACHKHDSSSGNQPSPTPSGPGGGHSGAKPSGSGATNDQPSAADAGAKEARHARGAAVPFGQRPPKPPKFAAPHVPELPDLAKQEKLPPPKAPTGEYACGASHSGESDYPLMCLEEKNHDKDQKVARVLVPYGRMKTKLVPLPRVVDHREENTEADVRNQGATGMCTAFSTSAGIDHSVSRWTGQSSHVSTMEIWGRYHQTDLADALIASVGQTFAAEEQWPFDPKVAWPWRDCPKGASKGDAECGKPVDKAKLQELAKKPVVVVEQVEWLPKDFELLRQKIAAGEDPVFAIRIPRHFKTVGEPGARYIPDYKDEAGGHALAFAGYALEKGAREKEKEKSDRVGENYYLIHNSWGPKWGDGGYAWIHEATLQKHMMNGFGVVDARPVSGAKAHREGKTCPAGQSPDSLTAACGAECKDGSPMHNGVCPELSDCPSGFVNLWGECIGAGPTDSGSEGEDKERKEHKEHKEHKEGREHGEISWKCGPGGCTYTLPKDLGKCSGEPCMLSCPAPSFRAAKDDHGLTCVE